MRVGARDNQVIRLTVPALWNKQALLEYKRLNEKYHGISQIVEVYGSHSNSIFGSGRASLVLPNVTNNRLKKFVASARNMGFDFNYLLNASCLGGMEGTYEGQRAIRNFARFLLDIGVNRVTITSPMLMELIRQCQPELKIGASVICYIDSVDKLTFFEDLGLERVSLDIDITRNFPLIRAMRTTTKIEIGLIVNSLCRIGCPMKTFHYNLNAHFSQDGQFISESGKTKLEASTLHYVGGRCMLQNHQNKASIMKTAWIRPEDLQHYAKEGIDIFKIQGRGAKLENMLKTVEMYMAGRTPSPIIPMSLIAGGRFGFHLNNQALDGFLDFFMQGPYRCNEGCQTCQYCYQMAELAVIEDEAALKKLLPFADNMVAESLTFDRETDQITQQLLEDI